MKKNTITNIKRNPTKEIKIEKFEDNNLEMPTILDQRLYRAIEQYRSKPGCSYVSLSEELRKYVEGMYEHAFALVKVGRVDEEALIKDINDQIPSEAYIRQYRSGRPICFRYTNTLANFFGIEYTVKNFNPSKNFEIGAVLKG